jgi:hypothetical protein
MILWKALATLLDTGLRVVKMKDYVHQARVEIDGAKMSGRIWKNENILQRDATHCRGVCSNGVDNQSTCASNGHACIAEIRRRRTLVGKRENFECRHVGLSELGQVSILTHPLHRSEEALSMYAQASVHLVQHPPLGTFATESGCPAP